MYYDGLNKIRQIFEGIGETSSFDEIVSKYKNAKKEELRHRVFFSVLKLVSKRAAKIARATNYSFEDLFQVGCLAVMEIVDKFDSGKENFFKLINQRIIHDMYEEVSNNKHIISLASQKITDYNRYHQFLEDIKEKTISEKEKRKLLRKKYKTKICEQTYYQMDAIIHLNKLDSMSKELFVNENVLEDIAQKEEVKLVKKLMSKLSPIEKDSINAQFGGPKRIYFVDLAKKYKTKNMNRFTHARDRGLQKLRDELIKLVA